MWLTNVFSWIIVTNVCCRNCNDEWLQYSHQWKGYTQELWAVKPGRTDCQFTFSSLLLKHSPVFFE